MKNKTLINFTVLLLITFAAFLLRLPLLFSGELWFDETHTVFVSKLSLRNIAEYLSFEENVPFFYYLLHYWMKLAGDSDTALRILPLIFGVAAIPVVFILAREAGGKDRSALAAAALAAFSPTLIRYSLELRMYSLVVLLSLISSITLLKAYRTNKWVFWLSSSVMQVLGLYSHLTFSFIIVAQNIVSLIYTFSLKNIEDRKNFLKKLALSWVLFALVFLPWFSKVINQLSTANNYGLGYTKPVKSPTVISDSLYTLFWQDGGNVIYWLFSATVFLYLFLSAFLYLPKDPASKGLIIYPRRDIFPKRFYLLCLTVVPLLFFILTKGVSGNIKFIVSSSVYLLTIIALGLESITLHKIRGVVLISSLFFFLSVDLILFNSKHQETNEIADYLYKHGDRGEIVLVSPSWHRHQLRRYYRGALPIIGFFPDLITNQNDLKFAMQEIKVSGSEVVNEGNVLKIEEYLKNYRRVWFLQENLIVDPYQLTWRHLVNNWRALEVEFFPKGGAAHNTLYTIPTLTLFERK